MKGRGVDLGPFGHWGKIQLLVPLLLPAAIVPLIGRSQISERLIRTLWPEAVPSKQGRQLTRCAGAAACCCFWQSLADCRLLILAIERQSVDHSE